MINKLLFHRVFITVTLWAMLLSLTACQGAERAKEPGFPSTEYVSSMDLFRLYIPTGWITAEDIPGAELIMANSEAALDNYRNGNIPGSGELVLNVGFLPLALFQEDKLAHLGIQFDAPPDVFLQSILPMFRAGDKPAGSLVREARLISLGDGLDAGMLTLSDEGREGLILMRTATKNVYAFISAEAYPGELQEFQEIAYEVAAGVTYTGSQDALYSILYGD